MNCRTAEAWMDEIEPWSRRSFTPSRLDVRTALFVIDMQRFFVAPDGDARLPDADAACARVAELLEAFRAAGLPVVFTRHEDRPGDVGGAMGRWWGNLLLPGSPQLEIVPGLEPRAGERVIRKNQYSAFRRTGLADALRADAVRGVVVSGVMTHLCCETTARDAFMEDFDVTCAVDAMAASSEELHLAALKTLANGFAVPALTAAIVRALKERRGESRSLEGGA